MATLRLFFASAKNANKAQKKRRGDGDGAVGDAGDALDEDEDALDEDEVDGDDGSDGSDDGEDLNGVTSND